MKKPTFLTELIIEELPAKELEQISKMFLEIFQKKINHFNIKYEKIENFSTPRRLAIKITNIVYQIKKKIIYQKGPSIQESFNKNGEITLIATKWAKKFKEKIKNKEFYLSKKQKYLLHQKKKKPDTLIEILKKITTYTIHNIPTKKNMYWYKKNVYFIRPIRNIVMLLDNKIIPIRMFNLSSTRYTYGHYLMGKNKITITHAKEYTPKLFKKHYILINQKYRKNYILQKIQEISKEKEKEIHINKKLLQEINSSVEWPVALLGKFDIKFLNIDPEILKYIIETHQKSFILFEKNTNKLTNYFIFISNIEVKNYAKIITENQQVLHSKLENIDFFIKKDLKIKLIDRLLLLKNILFQKNLGSLYEKTNRIYKLCTYIAKKNNVNQKEIQRAAILSKCDLTTNVVFEYPELQGIIGMYYANYDNENSEIAKAIKEQYYLNTAKIKKNKNLIGSILNISDKIDTITGMFYTGNIPKNNKDPHALRRYALSIVSIIIEKKIYIDIHKLIQYSLNLYSISEKNIQLSLEILEFICSKIHNFYKKINCYNKEIINSVLALKKNNFININNKIQLLIFFYQGNSLQKVLNLYKRINNFLKLNKEILYQKNELNITNSKFILNKLDEKIIFFIKKLSNSKKIYQDFSKSLNNILQLCNLVEQLFKNSFIQNQDITRKKQIIKLLYNIYYILKNICNFKYLNNFSR